MARKKKTPSFGNLVNMKPEAFCKSSKIGNLLGIFLYADECTSEQLRLSFARILIEIDVTKEIEHHITFENSNGISIKQMVKYDNWWPPFCKSYQKLGMTVVIEDNNIRHTSLR